MKGQVPLQRILNMLPNIHILATCRKEELLPATTLVFDTLRVGFPENEVVVWGNDLPHHAMSKIMNLATKTDAIFLDTKKTIHHQWIERLVEIETEPFIILDTDVIFWERCDGWEFTYPLAGRFIPKFHDEFTKCVTQPRIHGSFMYINPTMLKKEVAEWKAQFPDTPFNPIVNLFYPLVVPHCSGSQFYDTCALLYKVVGGAAFTHAQLDCYSHLNCGTISDIVAPHLTDIRMREAHAAVFENPQLARGVWRQQEEWYRKHAI